MQSVRTNFGSIDIGNSFIHQFYVYKKVSAYSAVNCHTMQTKRFKLDQPVEVAPK